MKNNPFVSNAFISVWCKHFYTDKQPYAFKIFSHICFFKFNHLPLFINIGKNLTKGMSYSLHSDPTVHDFKKKVFLIYDIPQYFNVNSHDAAQNGLDCKKVKQYPGFLINLDQYSNFTDFFEHTFSKKSIQKLNRYNKRLETCFDLNEKMLTGTNVDSLEYDTVFEHFHELLSKRFEDKQITNNNLSSKEWLFYKEVAYPLLLDGKAGLHVLYNDKTPISVRLLYFSESIVFDAITVFDIDYAKFHIGKLSIMKILQWSFENNYKIFDFSKGYFDYKESWSDLKYDFEYHIYYDNKSLKPILLANLMVRFFKIKQFLREKKINEKIHKLTFFLKKETTQKRFFIEEQVIDLIGEEKLQEVNLDDDISYLKKNVFDFLFLNSEHLKDLKVYKIDKGSELLFLLKGKNSNQLLAVNIK